MATWADVDAMAARLPGAVRGQAHEGSPAWFAGRHQFARLRRLGDHSADDVTGGVDVGAGEGELVQLWTGEMDTEQALADRRDTFVRIDTFRHRVTMWARLDRLDLDELAELLLDSYDIRGGRRRRGGTGLEDLLR